LKRPHDDGTRHPRRFREGLLGVARASHQKPPAEAGGMTLAITIDVAGIRPPD
jgi:hypothetical protein